VSLHSTILANESRSSAEFEINEETREYLKKLSGPIGVLSVAGMYRSGKSYLLNRVLLNRSRGFDVGHTINACTKVSRYREEL
jgi:polynucleotide 5'-kinase involved in rRNA processing